MVGKFARVFGIVFVLVGILGFVPQLTPSGNLLGLFPVNGVHNLVHCALGVWGLAVGTNAANAVMYFKSLTLIYGLLTVLGVIPATNMLFGLAPIGGLDAVLHAVLALAAAYFGFGPAAKARPAAAA